MMDGDEILRHFEHVLQAGAALSELELSMAAILRNQLHLQPGRLLEQRLNKWFLGSLHDDLEV